MTDETTGAQAPTPGPLDSESVKLLVKGDLLRVIEHGMACAGPGDLMIVDDASDGLVFCHKPNDPDYVWQRIPSSRFAFIGRHDADGWMPWSGGLRPIPPSTRVGVRFRDGHEDEGQAAFAHWWHEDAPDDVIAFRLVPAAPVEASGSERVVSDDLLIRGLNLMADHFKIENPLQRDFNVRGWPNMPASTSEAFSECAKVAAERLSALRPQPSGETRLRDDIISIVEDARNNGVSQPWDATPPEPWEVVSHAADRILALLSARPLALGGQQGDSETLRVLLDNLVIAQTLSKDIRQKATDEARSYLYDLRHTPALAEAQDEGAAGEPVAKVVRKGFSTGSISWTKFGQDADLSDETPLYAHPSPTPAADADRVRECADLFKALREESWDLRCFDVPTGGDDCDIGWRVVGHWQAEPKERVIAEVFVDDPAAAVRQALATPKSTAAKEGEEG